MSHDALDIKKHVRTYFAVFLALAALTVVTVGVSYLHLTTVAAVSIALLIATVKSTLVACYFMHLISEKKLIYSILAITAAFFLAMIFLIFFADQGMMKS